MKKPAKIVIVLTGPSGSGKSSVARLLARKGYKLLEADQVARDLYAPGKAAYAKIRRVFGDGFFDSKGHVDRKRLGALVFAEPAQRKRLNAILYPPLIRQLRRLIAASGPKVCVDMAVYFDAGAPCFGAKIWLVNAPLALRVARLLKKGVDPSRVRAQATALKFGKKERLVVDGMLTNDATFFELKKNLNLIFGKYDSSSR